MLAHLNTRHWPVSLANKYSIKGVSSYTLVSTLISLNVVDCRSPTTFVCPMKWLLALEKSRELLVRHFLKIAQCRIWHEVEPSYLQLILILTSFTGSCDEDPAHLIRAHNRAANQSWGNSFDLDWSSSLPSAPPPPRSPAITQASWICLLNFSHTCLSPSPVSFLAHRSIAIVS